ncbi:uncharacterized protein LOC131624225 [Vicia villosa]|uniref:uncharacterized protein LOC131624225 n=1 Tax=Vicia villosa TaxID=3911 RepID=UPI00273C5F09|nr:uncharacterized protein LOC131624225 [Vicia villosa]
MWSSKVGSKKHSHSFRCEDQICPNHKKKLHDRPKNNHNFSIREVPIQKVFNVEHCTNNASRDFSDFAEGKSYSPTGMNGADYDTPELVVFIQEDRHQQYTKDICIDRQIMPERKCDMNRNRTSDLNLGIMETMSNNSLRTNCASQHPSFKEAMRVHGFRNLMKSEMELSLGDRITFDHHLTKKATSETLREAFKRERNLTRSFENWQGNSILGSSGSCVEFPHCRNCLQVNDRNMYRPDMNYLQSLTTISEQRKVDYSREISNNALESQSGSTPCICHAKNSSIVSHQSNDSIGSANSFSFPILPVEWVGSPVKMMEADKSQSRKHQWRKIWLPCCD